MTIDREEVAMAINKEIGIAWEETPDDKQDYYRRRRNAEPNVYDVNMPFKCDILAAADAAIANIMGQLQEPSPAMINAGIDYALSSSLSGPGTWSKYITGLYKAMIAEALKEPSND